jgi:hypothetical protein
MFDESPDRLNRKILNIMIGELNEEKTNRPFLLSTVELDIADASTIVKELNFIIQKIFISSSQTENFKLLLSDKAPYCLKAGEMLKVVYPRMLHVTCICHGLHNFAETIRSKCTTINNFIKKFKKLLKNNSKNKRLFKSLTNLKIPKFPILTRWGTWLECSKWIYLNVSKMQSFLNHSIAYNLKQLYDNPAFDLEFIYIHELLKLPEIIKQLESSSLSIYQQIDLLKSARVLTTDPLLLERFDNILATNPDLEFFTNFSGVKSSSKYYVYAPLTTCWVERSFSAMKYILGDRRNMSVETLKQQLSLYFNKI